MQRIKLLLERYIANVASPEEVAEALQWLRDHEGGEDLLQEVWEERQLSAPAADWQRVWMQVAAATKDEAGNVGDRGSELVWSRVAVMRRVALAAAVVIALGVGIFLLVRQEKKGRAGGATVAATAAVPDVAPGRNGAILTLSDGSRVSLDSQWRGVPSTQPGAMITRKDNILAYTPTGAGSPGLTYNTVSTPRGRQFTLLLPDGSRVWLNAASFIRFPTAFTGHERRIEVSGEAYFEVAQDKSKPFIVHTAVSETVVLGTSFNVSAYSDDGSDQTTLVEGRVSLASMKGDRVLLAPGEQGQVKPGESVVVNPRADVEQAIAWKNGTFSFENVGLKEVMRQLARWYDLEIVYETGVPDVKFGGEMSRNVSLSAVLKGLKDMDVHFRIEKDHRLIVMP